MKEQLNNITRELQEISTKELTQQEKRENEKLYKKELKRSIKTILIEEIEKEQEKGETLENIYKNIVINDYVFIDKIIQDILNYKIIKTKTYKDQEGKTKKEQFIIYPFKDFDIAEDVDNIFYTILKSVVNRYKTTSEVLKNEALEELRQYFNNFYKKYSYTIARETLYKETSRNALIEATANRSKGTIQKNYYKTLNEIDKIYKITHKEETKQTQKTIKTSKNTKTSKKGVILGGLTIGLLSGFVKASK